MLCTKMEFSFNALTILGKDRNLLHIGQGKIEVKQRSNRLFMQI